MRCKRGFFAIKIDLEKAYDRINWQFIESALKKVNLLGRFIELIMNCVTTSSLNILWNGETTEEFRPSRGIRQGHPISPYLFVICMEKLSHMINDLVQKGD